MEQLFELPEYDNAFADFVHKAIHELMRSKDPLLSRVRVDYSDYEGFSHLPSRSP